MLELKIGDRVLYIEDIDIILEQCEKSRNILIDIPLGWKDIARKVCNYISKKLGKNIILSGRSCWGPCDITLDMLYRYDTIIHLGHFIPPNILNAISRNVDKLRYYNIDNISILEIYDRNFESKIVFSYIYYKVSNNDIHKIDSVIEKIKNSKDIVVLCAPQYRDYASYISEKLDCEFKYLTGCYMPKISNRDIVIISEGYFHFLTPILYNYPLDCLHCIDISKFYKIPKDHIERILRRLILTKLKILTEFKNFNNAIILISQKLGQRNIETAYRIFKDLSQRYSTCILEMDDVNIETLCSYRESLFINTMCPRLGFDDLDRFHVPIVNPGELKYIMGDVELSNYNVRSILEGF